MPRSVLRSVTLLTLVFWAVLAAIAPAPAHAQSSPTDDRRIHRADGFQGDQVYRLHDLDQVNLLTGNLSLTIPVGWTVPVGGGFSYGLTLVYNGNVWDFEQTQLALGSYLTEALPDRDSNAGVGWQVSLGRLESPTSPTNFDHPGVWVYHGPDGATHRFDSTLHGEAPTTSSAGTVFYSRDGSYLRLTVPSSGTRTLEFPDGTVHVFDQAGRLTQIRDRFQTASGAWANRLDVSYGATTNGGTGDWTLTDSRGRSHRVIFTTDPADAGRKVIDRIELAGPHSGTSTWDFQYRVETISASCEDTLHRPDPNDPNGTHTATVTVLDSVTQPDGTSFEFTYHAGDRIDCDPVAGQLASMVLPTKGKVEWDFGSIQFPTDQDTDLGLNPFAPDRDGDGLPLSRSTGVVERRTYQRTGTGAFVLDGRWTYDHALGPQIVGTGPFPDPPRYKTTEVTDPLGHRREHHFSVFLSGDATAGAGGWSLGEYGLALSRELGDGAGRFLSRRVWDASGELLRTVWSRWERDAPASSKETNRREASSKTVFEDDRQGNGQGHWIAVDRTNFDGFGQYRTETTTTSFPAGPGSRTVTTTWNDGAGTLGTNGSLGTWSNRAATEPWVLTTWRTRSITEGATTYTEEACFDETTGFRIRQRLRARASQGMTDFVTRWTANELGDPIREEIYGAGQQLQAFGDLCDLSLTAPGFREDRIYSGGVLKKAEIKAANGSVVLVTADRDIDANTGLVTTERDPAGLATVRSFDAMGRLVSARPDSGAWQRISYQNATATSPAEVRVGRWSNSGSTNLAEERFTFDRLGRLVEEKRQRPNGTFATKTHRLDALGQQVFESVWGNASKGTSFQNLDPFGRPGRIVGPDGAERTIAHTGVRRIETTTAVATGRDGLGNPVERDVTRATIHDAFGRPVEVHEPVPGASDPGERWITRHQHDPTGELTRVEMTAQVETVSDPSPGSGIFADGFESGSAGCWTEVIGGTASASGPCLLDGVSADRETITAEQTTIEQIRTFTRDGRGLLLTETHPELGTITYGGHTVLGDPTTVTRGGWTLGRAYDRAGRPLAVTDQLGRTWKSWTYASTNGPGEWSRGKLRTATRHNHVTDPTSGGAIDIQVSETFTYGGTGGSVSKLVTTVGAGAPPPTFEQTFIRDDLGDLVAHSYPECTAGCPSGATPARSVAFTQNYGWLTAVPGWASSITWHDSGLVDGITHANGVTVTQANDPSGLARPASITVSGASLGWSSGTFHYDDSGNVTEIGADWFVYDELSRLVDSEIRAPALGGTTVAKGQAYEFDRFGNLTAITTRENGTTTRRTTPVDPATNRLSGVPYDAAGSVTQWDGQVLGRDPFQMIATVGNTVTHVYGPGDHRIWQVDHTTSTWDESWTIRDLAGNVVRRLDKVGSTWSFGQDWIRRDGSLLAAALPGGLERHYHLDHLGSAQLITQQAGTTIGRFAYLPFGEDASEVSATFPETMRFTGHERDGVETAGWADDLDYMRARYCSPRWGRFLSVDPARESARVGVPQSWNRYSYVRGNPVRLVDPDGRVAESAWDAFNIGLGLASFADNVRQGDWGAAVVDGVGIVADVGATATPFVPGGAGSAIRVYRAADRAGETAGAVSAGARGVSRGGLGSLGRAGTGNGVREVVGDAGDARKLFDQLRGSNPVTEVKPGVFTAPGTDGGTVTFRATSKSGPPTVDVHGIEEGVRKIKFVDE